MPLVKKKMFFDGVPSRSGIKIILLKSENPKNEYHPAKFEYMGNLVLELLEKNGIKADVRRIGIPDKFIEHGSVEVLRQKVGLTKENIVKMVREMLKK